MKSTRSIISFVSIALIAAWSAGATGQTLTPQTPAPQSPAAASGPPETITLTFATSVLQQYKGIRDLLIKTADKMPAEHFAYQPVPEMRTFAGSLGHILASDITTCSQLVGRKHELAGQDLSKTMTAKADFVKTAESTFALCDEFFLKLDDKSPLSETFLTLNGRRNGAPIIFKMSQASSALGFIAHNNEEYGYLAVYMRLKGIVPPSSTPVVK